MCVNKSVIKNKIIQNLYRVVFDTFTFKQEKKNQNRLKKELDKIINRLAN